MAWLTNWTRRKQITVIGSTAGALSDYQLILTVNQSSGSDTPGTIYLGGNILSNFNDLRFTKSDGSTLLNYWIESITGTSPNQIAKVWIKLAPSPDTIPASPGTYNLYIYYNNPSATSQSNGVNTFPFFDNFVDNSLDTSKWIKGGAFGANINETNQRIEYYMPHSWDSNVYTYLNTNLLSNSKYWAWTYNHVNDMNGRSETFEVDFSVDGSTWIPPTWIFGRWSGSTYPDGVLSSAYNGLWEFKWNGTNSIEMFVAGISKGTKNLTIQPKFVRLQQHGVDTSYAGNLQFQIYNFRGRNYISQEPIWSTISSEQSVKFNISSNPSGGEIWLNTPSGTSNWADQHVQTPSTLYVPSGTSYDVMVGVGGYQQWFLTNVCTGNCVSGSTWDIVANPVLLPGSLAIYSTPTGASIYLDGSNTPSGTTGPGGTTLTNISVGSHPIRLSLTGYIDWTGTVTVNTQATTTVRTVFAGSAYITSIPTNSSIYLDGSPTLIADTPSTITNLTLSTNDGTQPTQSHTYILKLTGYADTSGSFTATAGSTINVPVTFPGSLYITSLPTGAQIYIDNILQP